MSHLNKGPSESFRKHIQQKIYKCNTITDKNQQKYLSKISLLGCSTSVALTMGPTDDEEEEQEYLIQIKLMTPKLNALLKKHKVGKPIGPVINNIQAASYKFARHLNKTLTN